MTKCWGAKGGPGWLGAQAPAEAGKRGCEDGPGCTMPHVQVSCIGTGNLFNIVVWDLPSLRLGVWHIIDNWGGQVG